MEEFLITYIEDNDLGVYKKEILEEARNFNDAYEKFSKEYPTIFGLQEIRGTMTEDWRKYYTHESQDLSQKSRREMYLNGLE